VSDEAVPAEEVNLYFSRFLQPFYCLYLALFTIVFKN